MASDVQVRKSTIDGAGRGLFAKKTFQPGHVVLSLERPYVAELDTARLGDTCAWCFQRGAADPKACRKSAMLGLPTGMTETKACSGCKKIRYCSKTCQTKAWKREHKYECKAISAPGRPDLPHGVRAVIKLLGRLKADPEGKDELLLSILQFKPASDSKALDNIREHAAERFKDFNMLAYGAWKYSGEPNFASSDSPGIKISNTGEATAKTFFFNIMSNTLTLSSPLDDPGLGIGFDPILCSANHSCEPNAAFVFNQPGIALRALKPIKEGQEITMKYISITDPFSIRQAELKEGYFFNCRCSKCKKGAVAEEDKFLKPIDQIGPEFVNVADSLIKRHEKVLFRYYLPISDETWQRRAAALQAEAFSVAGTTLEGNHEISEDEIKDALKLTLNSGLWPLTREPVPRLLHQLMTSYVEQGRTYPAWRIGIKMYFQVHPVIYKDKPHSPDRVIELWFMMQISNVLCNPDDLHSREIFQESMKGGLDLRVVFTGFLLETRDMVAKSYGRDSPLGHAVESMYAQIVASTDVLSNDMRDKVTETWAKLDAVAKSIDVLDL